MPSVLRSRKCTVCHRDHTFCRANDDVSAGQMFAFVCPWTGRTGMLRADAPGEPVRFYPTGAVAMESLAAGRAAA